MSNPTIPETALASQTKVKRGWKCCRLHDFLGSSTEKHLQQQRGGRAARVLLPPVHGQQTSTPLRRSPNDPFYARRRAAIHLLRRIGASEGTGRAAITEGGSCCVPSSVNVYPTSSSPHATRRSERTPGMLPSDASSPRPPSVSAQDSSMEKCLT
ncbi:hypothetical protein B0H10DRAFT_2216932 [Mycena sp. CBHHK59/15]|nr:hypothetical protein B0H10DRAFT_2216932 [Mycena sp. CBHHK59/15]